MKPGDVFDGGFHIEQTLGEGGFATVYGAIDPNGQRVALKVLKADEQSGAYDTTTRARFQREVDIVGRLQSPYVVRLYGAGQAQSGELFAVFEHVGGRDLAELLAAVGRLEARWVMHILRQLLLALDEAHRLGLLHRDLKPENVRVFEQAGDPMTVKLLDFGIARGTDDGHPAITRTGELIGTPRYMSPEQLTERPLTAASDLYSLGVMMFELLMGREQMGGHGWGAQLQRLQTGFVFTFPEIDRIGPGLLAVLQRLTARDPTQRFRSAAATLAALDKIEQNLAVEVSGYDDTAAPAASSAERRIVEVEAPPPTNKMIAAGALVAVALAVAVAALMFRTADDDPAPQVRSPRPNLGGLVAGRSEPETKSHLTQPGEPDAGASARLDVDLPPEDPRGGTTGCGKSPPFHEFGALRGRTTYATYVPRGYRENYKHPLILLLHQDGETSASLLGVSAFPDLAEPDHFIVMAPEYPTPINILGPMDTWRGDEDDVSLLREGFDQAADLFCIDPRRVFVVGNGNGGRGAHFASCEDWVAGIATLAYASGNAEHQCKGRAPAIPFVLMTPTDSPHAPIDGGQSCTPGEEREKFGVAYMEGLWRDRNRCSGAPPTTRTEGAHICYTWDCAVPTHSCHVKGGHGWPGSEPRALQDRQPCDGPEPTDFPVEREIWDVFASVELKK